MPTPGAPGAPGDRPIPASTPVSTPNPTNARVLLHSLEQLRDSLSTRVDQLSSAVGRLRDQVDELERSITERPNVRFRSIIRQRLTTVGPNSG